MADAEVGRLIEDRETHGKWRTWGAYVAERQWGTVREDYSADGCAWDYLPHDHARSRAYRWGEDGLFGWCDEQGFLNFAIGLWNEKDPILKERLFGLTNSEGNHGEDVKELYYYVDGLPSGAYMKALYKYPISAYPYEELIEVNKARGRSRPEYELIDSQALEDGWFDVAVTYAKIDSNQTAIRIEVTNQSDRAASIHVLGQLWFRNTWSWEKTPHRPKISLDSNGTSVIAELEPFPSYRLQALERTSWLFTENETNVERLFGAPNHSPYVKDAFHEFVVHGKTDAVNPDHEGTKAAAHYGITLGARETCTLCFVLQPIDEAVPPQGDIEKLFELREKEADAFYERVSPGLPTDAALVHRQCFAGLLWTKQLYIYDVEKWLNGDPLQPTPPESRLQGRNSRWATFGANEVLSMPDKWEYPWFAAWDLAFQAMAFALIDPSFAKRQMLLLMRAWYMHPNGQIPAYEWAFGDVNPPVHAWAAWRIYTIDRRLTGKGDVEFLEKVFHKLLLNFTWWVNRKDEEGNNIFEGGFLGLDNIGVFDRNMNLGPGVRLQQSDGTSWMAMFCIQMLKIALELAVVKPAFEDIATKFFEHFLYIAAAMSGTGRNCESLWDDEDGFYYDVLERDGVREFIKVRSAVGIIPLFAVTTLEEKDLEKVPHFRERVEWFMTHKPELTQNVTFMECSGDEKRRLLSIVNKEQLGRIMEKLFDEDEFLSAYGIRALSKHHHLHPYSITLGSSDFSVDYEPGESTTGSFGGNSNWRGPIWMPINYLLIESLQQFDYFYGDTLKTKIPSSSKKTSSLGHAAAVLEKRLLSIFTVGKDGNRPVHAHQSQYSQLGPWKDLVLFYEYFHGESGRGVGASHQTGWTAVISKIINQLYVSHPEPLDQGDS